jgi:hypothetical protein
VIVKTPTAVQWLDRCARHLHDVCKFVQRIPKRAAARDPDRGSKENADPVFPGSAVIGSDCLLPLNSRVLGSIPTRLTIFSEETSDLS